MSSGAQARLYEAELEIVENYMRQRGVSSRSEMVRRLVREAGPPDPVGEAARALAEQVSSEIGPDLEPAVYLFITALRNASRQDQAAELVATMQELVPLSANGELELVEPDEDLEGDDA